MSPPLTRGEEKGASLSKRADSVFPLCRMCSPVPSVSESRVGAHSRLSRAYLTRSAASAPREKLELTVHVRSRLQREEARDKIETRRDRKRRHRSASRTEENGFMCSSARRFPRKEPSRVVSP